MTIVTASSLLASGGGGAGNAGGIDTLSGLASFGLIMGAVGTLTSSIGAYYSTLAQRYQLRSQALDLEFQGSIANINARAAERDAHIALEAGRHEKAASTLRYGQAKESVRAQTAAAGVQAGVGSAAEVQASIELAKQTDSLTIERNAFRAAGASRARAVDFRNQALLSRVSAGNLRRFAKTMKPGLSALTSFIGGAGQVSSSYLYQQQFLQNRG
jgi:hypothetical protein